MNKNNEVVCFGEILWDVLPGRELPGGAPMNVTYHLSKLGRKATLISRVGEDERGIALKKIFEGKGIDTSFVQTDASHNTSIVLATPNEAGDMKYDIVEDVAWDYIQLQPDHEALISQARYFVFGSLAMRSKISRDTLLALMDLPCRKVLDINLRAPFINREHITYQLGKAEVVKMNEEELGLVAGWYGNYIGIEDKMRLLQDKFNMETLIVTRGAKGAAINYHNECYLHDGFKVQVADTIGSGDSFLAAFLSKFMENKDVEAALTFACKVGAFVATKEGGCPDYNVSDIDRTNIICSIHD
ncbi:carbohydrate kinase [Chitinophaga sp. 212800010-3]|uniref:carbohydrate kinase family protein n=1 Tax=unclassified Chitinophaga TaxID=2619133 RepID=UPI002DED6D62|nr:PfkB domain-containing protein [Chitinophaga sp. 212800010-3]